MTTTRESELRNTLLHLIYHTTFSTGVPLHETLEDALFNDVELQCQTDIRLISIPLMDEETLLTTTSKLRRKFPTNIHCTHDTIHEDCLFSSAYEQEPWCSFHSSKLIVCEGQWCHSRYMSYLDEEELIEEFSNFTISNCVFEHDAVSLTSDSEEEYDTTSVPLCFEDQLQFTSFSDSQHEEDSTSEPIVDCDVDTQDSGYLTSHEPSFDDNSIHSDIGNEDFVPATGSLVPVKVQKQQRKFRNSFSDVVKAAVSSKETQEYRSADAGPRITKTLTVPPKVNEPGFQGTRLKRKLHLTTKFKVASVFVERDSVLKVPCDISTNVAQDVYDNG